MDKFKKLKKEKNDLEYEKERLKELEKKLEEEIKEKEIKMADYYKNFFISKQNKDFELYDKFPNYEALDKYTYKYMNIFPLDKYRMFNTKELAELIKQLYQYKRQDDYDILTIGINEKDCDSDYGFKFYKIIPHLYFLIGNEKTLSEFREYDGKYYNNDDHHLYYILEFLKERQNLISIPLKRAYEKETAIDISTNSNSLNEIKYYDYVENYHRWCCFNKNYNIFNQYLRNIKAEEYHGIKDTLAFKMALSDSFIAKALMSIAIYKYNNQKTELTKEDYNHIFKELYNEEVDIIDKAKKDIPKSLVYVPNEKEEENIF